MGTGEDGRLGVPVVKLAIWEFKVGHDYVMIQHQRMAVPLVLVRVRNHRIVEQLAVMLVSI